MTDRLPGPERLSGYSDAFFAVIITIMVLDLRPPASPEFSALLPLWPAITSYTVSYLLVRRARLDQPPPFNALCSHRHARFDMGQFCTLVRRVLGAVHHRVDSRYA